MSWEQKKQESVANKEGSEKKKGRKRLLFVDLSSTN